MKANFFIKSDDVMMVFQPALSFFFKVTTLAYKKVELHIVYHGLAASQAKLGTMLAGHEARAWRTVGPHHSISAFCNFCHKVSLDSGGH